MALGYIDPNSGTYLYGSDDPAGPMHTTLNKGAQAEHNARIADRQRLDNLENAQFQIHNIVGTSFITLNPGFQFQSGKPQIIRRMGTRIEFTLRIEKTTGVLTHGGSVGYVKTEWRSLPNVEWQLVAHESGGGTNAGGVAAVLEPDGDIITLNPNGVSNILAVSGFYHTV